VFRADASGWQRTVRRPQRGSPWTDLAGDHDAKLENFAGNLASGWKGDGAVASPYRLEYTGTEERAVIESPLPELQTPHRVTR